MSVETTYCENIINDHHHNSITSWSCTEQITSSGLESKLSDLAKNVDVVRWVRIPFRQGVGLGLGRVLITSHVPGIRSLEWTARPVAVLMLRPGLVGSNPAAKSKRSDLGMLMFCLVCLNAAIAEFPPPLYRAWRIFCGAFPRVMPRPADQTSPGGFHVLVS